MKKLLIVAAVAALIAGCGKSVDVEGRGMYANANSGVVGIGSFEVVTVPDGNEAARIQYSEDTAWLSPSTKTHAFKINLSGTNSVDQVGGIVSDICNAFIATAPQIAAINSGVEIVAPTNGPGAVVTAALDGSAIGSYSATNTLATAAVESAATNATAAVESTATNTTATAESAATNATVAVESTATNTTATAESAATNATVAVESAATP